VEGIGEKWASAREGEGMRWAAAEKGEKWPKSELEVCTFFRKIEFEFEHGLK
jgi:hypothetical protein